MSRHKKHYHPGNRKHSTCIYKKPSQDPVLDCSSIRAITEFPVHVPVAVLSDTRSFIRNKGSAQAHDPSLWEEPEEFRPERFLHPGAPQARPEGLEGLFGCNPSKQNMQLLCCQEVLAVADACYLGFTNVECVPSGCLPLRI